jgi:CBS domain-containing protein
MKVYEVMPAGFQACLEDCSLARAAAILWEHDYGTIPVLDPEGHLTGILTDRAVLRAAATQPLPLSDVPIQKFLIQDVEPCLPGDDLIKALTLMAKQRVRRLPVVDEEGFVMGVVALENLLEQAGPKGALTDREVIRTLKNVYAAQRLPEGAVLCGWEHR